MEWFFIFGSMIRVYLFFLLLISFSLNAQVFKEDFGTGYDSVKFDWYVEGFDPLLTIYHCPPGKPDDGVFVITANTGQMFQESSCEDRKEGDLFFPGWHKGIKDHTPDDVNGRFLLVNALPFSEVMYQKTISGLEKGSVYEVSYWIANVLNGAYEGCRPEVPVDVELIISDGAAKGTRLKSVLLKIPTHKLMSQKDLETIWKNFTGEFKALSDTCTLTIRNVGSGGCGNDLALDDILIKKK